MWNLLTTASKYWLTRLPFVHIILVIIKFISATMNYEQLSLGNCIHAGSAACGCRLRLRLRRSADGRSYRVGKLIIEYRSELGKKRALIALWLSSSSFWKQSLVFVNNARETSFGAVCCSYVFRKRTFISSEPSIYQLELSMIRTYV